VAADARRDGAGTRFFDRDAAARAAVLRLAAFTATARLRGALFCARVTRVRLAEDRLAEDRLAEDRLAEDRLAEDRLTEGRLAAFRFAVERLLVGLLDFFFAARLATRASG
jgi:hypothetical protein